MSEILETTQCAIGDANDTTDLRPNVIFVESGGAGSGHYYVSLRMSPIPQVGDQVKLCGSIGAGVFVPDATIGPPGRTLRPNDVLTGTVESINWVLKGQPDDVRIEIELRDVRETDD